MMHALEILTGAREFLTDPAHWTKGSFGRDKEGRPSAEEACSACLVGALNLTAYGKTHTGNFTEHTEEMQRARQVLMRAASTSFLTQFNDSYLRTHAEVLNALDRAIQTLKETA